MSKRNKTGHGRGVRGAQSVVGSDVMSSAQAAPPVAAEQSKSKRQLRREAAAVRARQQRIRRYAIATVAALIALIIAGLIVRELVRPKSGEAVPVMASNHIPATAPRPDYNSNPPTSGPHYATPARQGFYTQDPPRDEALVHNLEHGYVIMWYDCTPLDQSQCDALKSQLRGVIDRAPLSQFTPTKKLIAVPRKDFGAQIALTAWGRILKLDAFDEAAINAFIQEWRDKGPEPQAP